eukprot:TRINITY_DN17390_c0_g1_i1.p1 TRINITY_DN17390_c0_g1~~TRINITY_DN17390_c0_g1_i1.p1  ORF type:complete len:900 (-),score=144.43 TRINITY_DN17390_c0_g1_i1:423-3122(-)
MAGLFAGLFGSGSGGGSVPVGGNTPKGGGSGSGGASGSASSPRTPSYSFARLQQLYEKLSQFRESDLEKTGASGGGEAVVETVRQITEALIWGEQNDTNFFDFFCEKSILANFIIVLGLPKAPKTVKVQLLQTLSMLVQNIRQQTSLYYLLSNNYVNHLISMDLDFSDEEILAYYITLLKSLAMRLNGETIKFFFLQNPEQVFPLYIEATKFFSHRDQMVRATVRTITLQVYRIEDHSMRRFVLRHASEFYFSKLAMHLRDLWLRLGAVVSGAGDGDLAALQHENELQQDLLIYLTDVFDLDVTELNDVLADRLLNCTMLPIPLAGAAMPAQALPSGAIGGRGDTLSGSPTAQLSSQGALGELLHSTIAPVVALFLLRQVFDTFRCRVLLEPLASALLQPFVPAGLAFSIHGTEHGTSTVADVTLRGSGFQQAQLVPNALREQFLKYLKSDEDALFLFSASVLHSCVKNRRALPLSFLEAARILPPRESRRPGEVGPEVAVSSIADMSRAAHVATAVAVEQQQRRKASPGGGYVGGESTSACLEDQQIELLMPLLHALGRHAELQLDTFQVLCRIFLDVFLDSALFHHSRIQAAASKALNTAVRSAALRLRDLLQENNGDDSVLDVILDEWELHKAPPVNVSDVCTNPRRLLQSISTCRKSVASLSSREENRKRMQKAVRCFFVLRRTFLDFVKHSRTGWGGEQTSDTTDQGSTFDLPPWAGQATEASPFQLEEETAENFSEGMSFEIGRMDRIVCGVAAPNGKHTRYLLLHDFWLILARPDLSAPGWVVVKTLWPLWQTQAITDRSDPRTLRIGMVAHRSGPCPGEAVPASSQTACSSPPEPGEEQASDLFTLALNFEDVRRCHAADIHLQRRRQDLRARQLRKAVAFVERCCSQVAL